MKAIMETKAPTTTQYAREHISEPEWNWTQRRKLQKEKTCVSITET